MSSNTCGYCPDVPVFYCPLEKMYACSFHSDFHTTECHLIPFNQYAPNQDYNFSNSSVGNPLAQNVSFIPNQPPNFSASKPINNQYRAPDLGVPPKGFNFNQFNPSAPSNPPNPNQVDRKVADLSRDAKPSQSGQPSNNLHLSKNPQKIEVSNPISSANQRSNEEIIREINEMENKIQQLKQQVKREEIAPSIPNAPLGYNGNVRVNLPPRIPVNEEQLNQDDERVENFNHMGVIKFCKECHRDAVYYCKLHEEPCCDVHYQCHLGHPEHIVALPRNEYGKNNKVEREAKRIIHQIEHVIGPIRNFLDNLG